MEPSGTRGSQPPKFQPTVFDPDLQTDLQSGWNADRTPITVNEEELLLNTESATEVDDSQADPFPPSSDQWGPEEWDDYLNSLIGSATTSQATQSPARESYLPQMIQSPQPYRETVTYHAHDLPESIPSRSCPQVSAETMSCGQETGGPSRQDRQSQTETYLRQMIMCASLGFPSEPELPKSLKRIVDILGPHYRTCRSKIPQRRKEERDPLDAEFELFCRTQVEKYMRRKWEVMSG